MTYSEHIRDQELELYALGGMADEEMAALKAHVAACGECAMKLARSRGNAALLSFTAQQEEPAGTIKAELMARIRANHEREVDYAWPVPKKMESNPGGTVGVTNTKGSAWWNRLVVPAAVALALLSLGLSWQNRKVSLTLEKQRLATQALLQERERTEKLIAVLAAGDTLTIKLAPAGEIIGSAVVRYNARMGMAVYSAQLPAAPAGKNYQMWLVPASGSAINAGLLEKGAHSVGSAWIAELPANTEAKTFAVTREPAGGVLQPTGEKILVGAL